MLSWHQGETDAASAGDASAYFDRFTNMVKNLREHWPNMRLSAGRIHDGRTGANDDVVRDNITNAVAVLGNAVWVDTDDYNTPDANLGHFSGDGLVRYRKDLATIYSDWHPESDVVGGLNVNGSVVADNVSLRQDDGSTLSMGALLTDMNHGISIKQSFAYKLTSDQTIDTSWEDVIWTSKQYDQDTVMDTSTGKWSWDHAGWFALWVKPHLGGITAGSQIRIALKQNNANIPHGLIFDDDIDSGNEMVDSLCVIWFNDSPTNVYWVDIWSQDASITWQDTSQLGGILFR